MALNLPYYYGKEAEQYSFYRIPKELFTGKAYQGVSAEAKILYGLMLDRMGLSVKNGWLDEKGRVYVYFTLEDAQRLLSCGHGKAVRLFSELDTATGIGLIERVKQGQGKPTRIYVKNFIQPEETPESKNGESNGAEPLREVQTSENRKSAPGAEREKSVEIPLTGRETPQKEGIYSIHSLESGRFSVEEAGIFSDPEVQTSENGKSRLPILRSQDFRKPDANKTEKNKTEFSEPYPSSLSPPLQHRERQQRTTGEMQRWKERIRENIDYEFHVEVNHCSPEQLDGYVELMAETITSKKPYIRINQEDIPAEQVKRQLLKLSGDHVEYVMDSLESSGVEIRNIRAYMLSSLYNAANTFDQYLSCKVQRDLYGSSG